MATLQKSKRSPRRGAKKPAATRSIRARAASRPRTNGTGKRSKPRTNGTGKRQQVETLRLRSVTPTYTVNDLQRSLAWYCDGLGFVVSERWENDGKLEGVMLKAGSCEIGLSQDDFSKGRDRQKGIGFRIHANTVQSVDALADRVRAYGGKIIMEPTNMPWGARSFAVEDPDGFKISFNEPR